MSDFYRTVFENEHFVLVDKAAMVLSVPSRMGASDPRPCLGHLLEHDLKCQIYPVHRLDFEVSGLIMYAKTAEAHRAGNSWFENKVIDKTYVALTSGENAPTEKIGVPFEWKCMLLRGKKRAYESPLGKSSITRGVLIVQNHWNLNPVTGRSHQLRYELYRHGYPIIGDELYGSPVQFNVNGMAAGIALRAFEINFSKIPERSKFGLEEKIKIFGF